VVSSSSFSSVSSSSAISSSSSVGTLACAADECGPKAVIDDAAMVLYLTNDTANFAIDIGDNKNCYENVRYSFNGGPWVDAVTPRVYSKNVYNALRVDWGFGGIYGGGSYDFNTVNIVGMTGVPTYYGCYNMADNARELTEGCLLGYYAMALQDLPPGPGLSPVFFNDPTFVVYTSFIDSVATELTTRTNGHDFPHSGAAGVRLATIDNPLNYSCFVPVGDVGNTPHTVSARPAGDLFEISDPYAAGKTIGQVNYAYQLQKFELTRAELLEFLNTCFKSDPNHEVEILACTDQFGDANTTDTRPGGILRSGSPGNYSYTLTPYTTFTDINIPYDPAEYEKIPAFLPMMLALRLCNWLHNRVTNPNTTYTDDGAYDLTGFSFAPPDEQYSGFCIRETFTTNQETGERTPLITRKPGAKYFIPNADEWFKAAFYKGGSANAGYWQYLFNVDSLPDGSLPTSGACPHTSETDYAYPLSTLDPYTFTPLRFNCAAADCSGITIDVDGILIGADPDGFNGTICFKAFATNDCESAEKCIPVNICPKTPDIINFQTRFLAAVEGQSGTTNMVFSVVRTSSTNKRTTSVNWAVTGHGTNPASANDFVGGVYPSGTLTFPPGQHIQTITIPIQGDSTPELTEEFLITLSNPVAVGVSSAQRYCNGTPVSIQPVLGNYPTAIGQILTDEPVIRFDSDESAPETGSPTGLLQNNFITFTVLKIGAPTISCSVDWAISAHGTDPVSASDFASNSFATGTLTFASGETSKPITVEIQDDLIQEENETFKVVLSNPSGCSLGSPVIAYGTIIDNDDPAKSNFIKHNSLSVIQLPEGDTGLTNFDFEIARVNVTGVMPEISVDWAVTPPTTGWATAPWTDFNNTIGPGIYPSGTLTFAENETSKIITIEVLSNTVADGDRAFALTLSNVVGGALLQPASRLAYIKDDDAPPPPLPVQPACQISPITCGSFDISGAKIVAIYDNDPTGTELCSPMYCFNPSPDGTDTPCDANCLDCRGKCGQNSHSCNRAIFDFALNGRVIGQINLNNAGPPDTGLIPPGGSYGSRISTIYVPQLSPNEIPSDGNYNFSMTCALLQGCHFGIVWLQIYDTKDNLIFCDCVTNDQLIIASLCVGKDSNPPPGCHADSSSSSAVGPVTPVTLFDKSSWAGVVPEPYKTYLDAAADRWMQYVDFDPAAAGAIQAFYASRVPAETWTGIKLEAYEPYYDLDGDNKDVFASCGPTRYADLVTTSASVKFNATKFLLQVNTSWASSDRTDGGPLTAGQWIDILTHELGHALGIGTFWDPYFASAGAVPPINNFLDGASYVNAKNAYNHITGLTRSKVPLEDGGGAGTTSAHWENNYRASTYSGGGGVSYSGLYDELMIGFFDPNDPTFTFKLSRLSVRTLVDFGYVQVAVGEADPQVVTGLPMAASGSQIKHLNCKLPLTPQKDTTICIDNPPY